MAYQGVCLVTWSVHNSSGSKKKKAGVLHSPAPVFWTRSDKLHPWFWKVGEWEIYSYFPVRSGAVLHSGVVVWVAWGEGKGLVCSCRGGMLRAWPCPRWGSWPCHKLLQLSTGTWAVCTLPALVINSLVGLSAAAPAWLLPADPGPCSWSAPLVNAPGELHGLHHPVRGEELRLLLWLLSNTNSSLICCFLCCPSSKTCTHYLSVSFLRNGNLTAIT